MSLYVQYCAHLDATLEPPQGSSAKKERVTRRMKLGKDAAIEMPPIRATFLIAHLFDVGPVRSGGMGAIPITSENLIAWQRETGVRLLPWQAQMLRRLSGEYLAQLQKSEAQNCPAPWKPTVISIEEKLAVANRMKTALRAMSA